MGFLGNRGVPGGYPRTSEMMAEMAKRPTNGAQVLLVSAQGVRDVFLGRETSSFMVVHA